MESPFYLSRLYGASPHLFLSIILFLPQINYTAKNDTINLIKENYSAFIIFIKIIIIIIIIYYTSIKTLGLAPILARVKVSSVS